MRGEKSIRSQKLPNRYFKIGSIASIDGKKYEVVLQGNVPMPYMVCNGCDLKSRNCDRVQCRRADRIDGKNVWFIEIKDNENHEEGKC